MVEIFKHTLFSNLFFENPYLLRADGWAIMFMYALQWKSFKNLNHDWEDSYMMYTLDYYCCFNWYHWILLIGINFDLFVYSYVYCVCILSIGIIYWWLVLILFHTHIHVLFVLLYFYILSTNLVFVRAWTLFLSQ